MARQEDGGGSEEESGEAFGQAADNAGRRRRWIVGRLHCRRH